VRNNNDYTFTQLSNLPTYQAGMIEAAAHRTTQKICDKALEEYALTTMQWLMIGAIYDAKGMPLRLTDLAKQLNTGLPYLTNTLNLLESRSIVGRVENNQDARSKMVIINKNFAPIIPEIEAKLRDALRQTIYSRISTEDFEIYIKVMMQLTAN
jgi:DNA-binding MarR family transcriptional regulator